MTAAPPTDSPPTAEADAEPGRDGAASDRSAPRSRRQWSLQTRLMVTVIGIVSLILVIVAVATSAALGSVLEKNLDSRLENAAQQAGRGLQIPQFPGGTRDAYDVLNEGRQEPGFLFIVQPIDGAVSGAYVDQDGEVVAHDEHADPGCRRRGGSGRVQHGPARRRLGDYRVVPVRGDTFVAIAGLPVSEVRSTIAAILTTIALVTAGGLLLLAAAIALVIRAGLAPLRAVADTATRVADPSARRRATSRSPSACPTTKRTSTPRSAGSATR